MKKCIISVLLLAVFTIFVVACSKDEEESSSKYTTEQIETLKVLHGSFSNTPDMMTGNMKTTFEFYETYLSGPKTIIATNYYEEKSELTIHGHLQEIIDFQDGDRKEYNYAFYLASNGSDLTLYHMQSDKSISLNLSPKKYKVIIKSDNQIRLIDMDFPYSAGQYYNRNN